MTYHLGRITSWISQGSVEYFPTAITPQLFQPPFAEYVIMHINLLAGNDYFSAAVQFCFLLFMLITLTCIIKVLGLHRRYQVLAIVFGAFIPEVLLQASSTQNNIVETFFVLTAYYFTIQAVKENKLKNYLFLGIAAGLALLTKATAYIYLFPVLLFFAVNVLAVVFKTRNFKGLWHAAMVIIICLAINCRQYQRNYNLNESLLGASRPEISAGTNVKMNPLLLLSNIIKNAGLQMNIMGTAKPAVFADSVIHKLHAMARLNINSGDNNFAGANYKIPTGGANHEDAASNLFHFLLIIAALGIIVFHFFKGRQNALIAQLFGIVLLQVILFCWFLKWQPWNTRMHVQFFLLSVPLFCYAVSISGMLKKAVYILMPVIIVYGFLLVLHNAIRPYIVVSKEKPYLSIAPVFDPRYKKYFVNREELYPEYREINEIIQTSGYKNIGLVLGFNDWQYPLFTNCYSKQLTPVHLFVLNYSKHIRRVFTHVDCIISTRINKAFIDYMGKRFYQVANTNKFIYIYR